MYGLAFTFLYVSDFVQNAPAARYAAVVVIFQARCALCARMKLMVARYCWLDSDVSAGVVLRSRNIMRCGVILHLHLCGGTCVAVGSGTNYAGGFKTGKQFWLFVLCLEECIMGKAGDVTLPLFWQIIDFILSSVSMLEQVTVRQLLNSKRGRNASGIQCVLILYAYAVICHLTLGFDLSVEKVRLVGKVEYIFSRQLNDSLRYVLFINTYVKV